MTLAQYGGGWLLNIFPRKGAFWGEQVFDYFNVFASNFVWPNSRFILTGLFPGILALFGLVHLIRKNWRLGLGWAILFIFSSVGAIIYFNVPSGFFRSMDRHYLPSIIIAAVIIVYGAINLLLFLQRKIDKYRRTVVTIAALLLIIIPISQIARNYRSVDGSNNSIANDMTRNIFSTLPENAIFLTGGDNETWPPLYMQIAEGQRKDVIILNVNLFNTSWYNEQFVQKHPELVTYSTKEEIAKLRPMKWQDTIIAIVGDNDRSRYQLPENIVMPDSLLMKVAPTINDEIILIQDLMMIDIIKANKWKRPIYISSTMPNSQLPWLLPYLRPEGIALRMIPMESPPINTEILSRALFEKYTYQGYSDTSLPLELSAQWSGWSLYGSFILLAQMEMMSGDTERCLYVKSQMLKSLPIERLLPPEDLVKNINGLCGDGRNQE